jgi:hypothetical protein
MTIVPLNLHEPLRKLKRYFGFFILTEGALVIAGTLLWIALYFSERGLNPAAIWTTASAELGYWSPILVFDVPALLLIFDGKRMVQNEPISLFGSIAALGLAVATIVVAIIALPQNY